MFTYTANLTEDDNNELTQAIEDLEKSMMEARRKAIEKKLEGHLFSNVQQRVGVKIDHDTINSLDDLAKKKPQYLR